MFALMIARVLFLFSFFLLTACNDTYTWRQNLTVVVQTPDGEVSGSSVTEITLRHSDGIWVLPEARGVHSDISGEAVVIEVASERYIFVLLDNAEQLAAQTFTEFPYRRSGEFKRWARAIERHRGSGEVPPEYYPMMVTFEDIDDPKSVRLVDPNDLAATFGEGHALDLVTLTITDEETTVNVVETFALWAKLKEQITFSGLDRFDPKLPDPVNYLNYRVMKAE